MYLCTLTRQRHSLYCTIYATKHSSHSQWEILLVVKKPLDLHLNFQVKYMLHDIVKFIYSTSLYTAWEFQQIFYCPAVFLARYNTVLHM